MRPDVAPFLVKVHDRAGDDALRGRPGSMLLVTDAWHPQVNGVVRALDQLTAELSACGIRVARLSPECFPSVPTPGYAEIRLALADSRYVQGAIDAFSPDAIHIATEGPLGHYVRRYCIRRGFRFSTAYHTQYPEYIRAARIPVPLKWSYAYLRRFHAAADVCLVSTKSIQQRLERHGFTNTAIWSFGVDTTLFHPGKRRSLGLPGPIFLYVGRVSVEKNLSGFLDLDLPGTKVVVGDGPQRLMLERRYPDVMFVGYRQGESLARYYASADVFVFPSKTDTFGLVMLEALASGTPVAAFNVAGPKDVIGASGAGALGADLRRAALQALSISRETCRQYASRFSWQETAQQFIARLSRVGKHRLSEKNRSASEARALVAPSI